MLPEERDAALLWDMQQAASEIVQFVEGANFARFQSDKMLRYAVERQILVIGEAAKNLSATFKSSCPQIPWTAIVPELIKSLTPLVPKPPE